MDRARVVNLARNGRSTGTFIEEGRWREIVEALRPGDYVFIQFHHNDASVEKADRYTPPAGYRRNESWSAEERWTWVGTLDNGATTEQLPFSRPPSSRTATPRTARRFCAASSTCWSPSSPPGAGRRRIR